MLKKSTENHQRQGRKKALNELTRKISHFCLIQQRISVSFLVCILLFPETEIAGILKICIYI